MSSKDGGSSSLLHAAVCVSCCWAWDLAFANSGGKGWKGGEARLDGPIIAKTCAITTSDEPGVWCRSETARQQLQPLKAGSRVVLRASYL
jgi:hypothetical protein